MKRAIAPSYDLFKLAVTIVLLVILLLMVLRGCATSSAAPSAPTNNPPADEPAASEASVSLPTNTAEVPASSTPESIVPSSTPTAPQEPTPTPETESDAASPAPKATETPTTNAETATPAASQNTVCNTSVPSQLSVGQSAQVVQRLNMRSQPLITAPILQTNPVNTQVEIIGGPICTPVEDGGYLWWQIRLADGAEGWSAESPLNDATYLLEPVP
jgi:hypothetical protein